MWRAAMLVLSGCVVASRAQQCSATVSSACGAVFRQGLNATERTALLDQHNALRSRVARGEESRGQPGPQPAASNMRTLVWDAELARLAQNWANQCVFRHNLCGGDVGQNLYTMTTTQRGPPDLAAAVNSWYDEVTKFGRQQVSSYRFETSTGHYTQVVWAETHLLGCGYIGYSDTRQHHTLVCNYGPAGNVISRPVYQTGKTCSACTTCNPRYPALCG
ncbi:venom allergen 5-like [Bacillus rossius redtenbacheri]|uniref:venom allergen 5-like n=1 Tax=Bacillus rossius redtenbacheri TaxID=93214 RepID=UPI002FDEA578